MVNFLIYTFTHFYPLHILWTALERLIFYIQKYNTFTVRKTWVLAFNPAVIVKFDAKLSKYESDKNSRSKSYFFQRGEFSANL